MPNEDFLAAALLLSVLLGLLWFARKDAAEFRRFKQVTDPGERLDCFRRWTLRAMLLFGGSALAGLAVLGRLDSLLALPPEFAPLSQLPGGSPDQSGRELDLLPVLLGAGIAMIAGSLTTLFVMKWLKREPKLVGDVDSLIPRNRAEGVWALLMSINAGVSEELFFRLLLPLLLVQLTGSVLFAFAIATLLFGAAHLYQGWSGVAMTTAIGALMAGLYLLSGILWVAVAAHMLMNVNGLIVRPLLAASARRQATRLAADSR